MDTDWDSPYTLANPFAMSAAASIEHGGSKGREGWELPREGGEMRSAEYPMQKAK